MTKTMLWCLASIFLLAGAKGLTEHIDQSGPNPQPKPNLPKSFHDDALNITYFYPAHFMPEAPAPAAGTKCVQTTLLANSNIPAGPSSFVLTTIDNTCPDTLREATGLSPFVRTQILRQLKQYGEPRITREPLRYVIDGRPAAITLASVSLPLDSAKGVRTVYAAKACALGTVPVRRHRKSAAEPISRVLCFDFSTENGDLLNLMFSFIIQFDNDPLEPVFLAGAYQTREPPLRQQRNHPL